MHKKITFNYQIIMTRAKYWLLLTIVPVVIGLISRHIAQTDSLQTAQAFSWQAMIFVILVYIPVVGILRMRYLKFTWKEVMLSLVPFLGSTYKYKRLFNP